MHNECHNSESKKWIDLKEFSETEDEVQDNSNFRMEENALETNNNFNTVDSSCSTAAPTTLNVSNDREEEEILELYVSPERTKFKKFNLPNHGLCIEIKCDSCKRNSTQATGALVRKFQPRKIQQIMGK